jgi:hypothetical protein
MITFVTNEDRQFLDIFCRLTIMEWVDKTQRSDKTILKNFIWHEAEYKDIIRIVYDRDFSTPLFEADASQELKLQNTEKKLAPIAKLGFAIAMAGPAISRATKWIMGPGGKMIKKLGISATVATGAMPLLIPMGLEFGASLVSKLIFTAIKVALNKCKKTCKASMPKDIDNRSLRVKICTGECKVRDVDVQIAKIRGEIAKCKRTANPEKCQVGLIQKVAELNEMKIRDQAKLTEYKKILSGKIVTNKDKTISKSAMGKGGSNIV